MAVRAHNFARQGKQPQPRSQASEAVLPQEGLHIDVAFHLLLSRIPGGHVSETAEGHAPVLVAGDTSGDTWTLEQRKEEQRSSKGSGSWHAIAPPVHTRFCSGKSGLLVPCLYRCVV